MTQSFQDPNLAVVRITDFSAGVVQYGRGSQGVTYGVYAPLGSAALATGCISQHGVGLVPMPARVPNVASVYPHQLPQAGQAVLTGLRAVGPVTNVGTDPLTHVISDHLFSAIDYPYGGFRQTDIDRRYMTNNLPSQAISQNNSTHLVTIDAGYQPASFAWGRSFGITRFNAPGGGVAKGVPTIAWADFNSVTRQVYMSPDPSNNTNDVYVTTLPITAWVESLVGHEFRLVMMIANNPFQGGDGTVFATNEDFWYTDPPGNYIMLGTTGLTSVPYFDPENASGWGAWGSVNAGELVLIRKGGGAIVLDGDVAVPNVTKLPGVQGTGRMMQEAAQTANGLIYLCESDGAWTWNGSNGSSKISSNIPDDALQRNSFNNYYLAGVSSNHVAWNEWVMFAHNWVWDGQAWWQIESTSAIDNEVWCKSASTSRFVYAAPGEITADGVNFPTIFVNAYDRLTPQSAWVWESNPIPGAVGVMATVESIEIVASNPSNNSVTFTIYCLTANGNQSNPVTFTIPAKGIGVRLSQRVSYTNYNIQVHVAANNSGRGAAPVLHELSVGFSNLNYTATN